MDWNAIINNNAYQIAAILTLIIVYATNLIVSFVKKWLPGQVKTLAALVIGGLLGAGADAFIVLIWPGWVLGAGAVVAYNVYWDIDPTGSLIDGIRAKIGITPKPPSKID